MLIRVLNKKRGNNKMENVNMVQNNEEKYEDGVRGKIIFKYAIAKRLCDCGHKIINLKRNKEDPTKLLFVFEDSLQFRDDFVRIVNERKKRFEEMSANKD